MSKSRRGIHTLLSVVMLIGFTLVGASLLLVVLFEYGDIATNNASCAISDASVYRTGTQSAYFTATLHNLGSISIHKIDIVLISENDGSVEIVNRAVDLAFGQSLDVMKSFSISSGLLDAKSGLVLASAIFEDGSRADCIT